MGPVENVGQQIRRRFVASLAHAPLQLGHAKGFFIEGERIHHVVAGKDFRLGRAQGNWFGNELKLMATVTPEVRRATGQLGDGVFRQPEDDGAGHTLPLLAGTVEGAERGLGVVRKRNARFEIENEHRDGRFSGQLAANAVIDIAGVHGQANDEHAGKLFAEALDQGVAQRAVIAHGKAEGESAARSEHHAPKGRHVGSLTRRVGVR